MKVHTKKQLMSIISIALDDADLNYLDVSAITDMSYLFTCSDFNGKIDKWDVSNVTDMSFMFANSKFNGDLSEWNVSKSAEVGLMFLNSKMKKSPKWYLFMQV